MNAAAIAPLAYASRPQPRAINDNEGLIIDLFAGGGGASEAIFEETGRHPDIAVNHDREAIALHSVNHPTTLHLCEDIRKVDIGGTLALPQFRGRWVDLMWASPDCKDHSKAKGGKPKDKNIRGLAWEVLRWAAAIKRATGKLPRIIALENVEEFADWGPIHTQGKRAGMVQKRKRKKLFNMWKEQLRSIGFHNIEHREVVAADHGAPTTRKRLFLIARSDGGVIAWPQNTFGKVHSAGDLFAAQINAWRPAADIIDWSIPIPSIFGRKRPLKEKTHRRLARGIKRFVIESARPFIVPVTHTQGGDSIRTTDDPLKTVTTAKGGELAVAAPVMTPVNHGGEDERAYSAEDPVKTITAAPRGEQALIASHLLRTDMQSAAERNGIHSPDEPLRTITSGGGMATAAVHITKFSENSTGTDPADPLHTAMAGAPRHGLVAAHLQRQFGTTESGRDLKAPHPTVMSDGGGGKSQVVAAHLSGVAYGDDRPRAGDRNKPLDQPTTTITGSNDKSIVAATLDRQFGRSAGAAVDHPVGAITAGGMGKTNLAAVHMDQHNGDRVGAAADEPLSTIVGRGTQQKIAAAVADKYFGTGVAHTPEDPLGAATTKGRFSISAAHLEQANSGMVGHAMEEPVSTIVAGGASSGWGTTQRLVETVMAEMGMETTGNRMQVLEFLWHHFDAPTAEEIADPLATAGGRLKFGLVVVDGVIFQIVDIGMRMLTPRELYSAQGFAPHYIIDITLDGKPLTKTAQTRMAGNSVSPPPARAILRCNLPEQMLMRRAA